MTFNTGNPVSSTDPRDLYDTAGIADKLTNGNDPFVADRLGKLRLSWAGMEADHANAQEGRTAQFQQFLLSSGYETPVSYAQGVTLDRVTQTFVRNDILYRIKDPAALPYTLTGDWNAEADNFTVVADGGLRQELADADGAEKVGLALDATVADLTTDRGASLIHTRRTALAEQVSLAALARQTISALEFGMTGDGSDVTEKMQALRDYVASLNQPPMVVFPAGDYVCSAWPNWNIPGLILSALGSVYWTNTGTGDTVIIDAGPLPGKISNVNFGVGGGQIIARGGPTSGNAFTVRGLVRGQVKGRVYGCGTDAIGLWTRSAVLVNFDVNITPDETAGWYMGAKPQFGYLLDGNGVADTQTSYCTFVTPSVQGCQYGIWLAETLGNVFLAGDSEYNDTTGVHLTNKALNNKFFGTDFEVNGSRDIDCYGHYNEFHACDSNTTAVINAGAKNNQLLGGNFDAVEVIAGALDTLISRIKYGRGLSGKVITDAGTRTRFRDNMNLATGKCEDAPKRTVTVTGTSPVTYTNNTGNALRLTITGGTVTQLSLFASGAEILLSNSTNIIPLSTGDSVVIQYSAAPTMLAVVG